MRKVRRDIIAGIFAGVAVLFLILTFVITPPPDCSTLRLFLWFLSFSAMIMSLLISVMYFAEMHWEKDFSRKT